MAILGVDVGAAFDEQLDLVQKSACVQRVTGRRDRGLPNNRAIRLSHTAANPLFVYVQAYVFILFIGPPWFDSEADLRAGVQLFH
jgi:hypothetical protein